MVFIMTIPVNCSLEHNYHLRLGKREPGSFTTRKWGEGGGDGDGNSSPGMVKRNRAGKGRRKRKSKGSSVAKKVND